MRAKLCFISLCQKGEFGDKRRMVVGTILGLVEGTLDWRKSTDRLCPGVLEEPPTKQLWQLDHNNFKPHLCKGRKIKSPMSQETALFIVIIMSLQWNTTQNDCFSLQIKFCQDPWAALARTQLPIRPNDNPSCSWFNKTSHGISARKQLQNFNLGRHSCWWLPAWIVVLAKKCIFCSKWSLSSKASDCGKVFDRHRGITMKDSVAEQTFGPDPWRSTFIVSLIFP